MKIIVRLANTAALLVMCPALAVTASAQMAPERIIALGGDITEIVYQLGSGNRLAGRDSTSTFPPEANDLPNVGYVRQLGAEGIISLRPDLILASASAGPPEVLTQIEATGIKVVRLPNELSAEGLLDKTRMIAAALNIPEAGNVLAEQLEQELDQARTRIAAMEGTPKVLFIIGSGGGDLMAAGRQTAADVLIELAAAENVFASHKGYKTMSLESAAAASPDAIALMEHTLKAMGGVEQIVKHPALKLTPAARAERIVVREGSYLLSFGRRLPEAMIDFAKAIRMKGQS